MSSKEEKGEVTYSIDAKLERFEESIVAKRVGIPADQLRGDMEKLRVVGFSVPDGLSIIISSEQWAQAKKAVEIAIVGLAISIVVGACSILMATCSFLVSIFRLVTGG